ncbi:hypothetical protein GOZ83_19675 [Agrobacterium vitis]|uniref:hypothetical protein n=1 Tax=Agrobacterium vitis TaxID=373 RepID=UPI0012E8563B|nr:hypothetical protein [Agrobacterium vitis]MVA47278.1 hypothetical protein [Agrobacterium vitis]
MAKSFLSRLLSSLRIFPRSEPAPCVPVVVVDEERARQRQAYRAGKFTRTPDEDDPRLMGLGLSTLEVRGMIRVLSPHEIGLVTEKENKQARRKEVLRLMSQKRVSVSASVDDLRERPVDFPSTQDLVVGLTAYSLLESSPSAPDCSSSNSYSSDSSSYSSSDSGSSSFDSGSCSSD